MLTQHIRESLQVTPGPFPDFWVGPGDEAISVLQATESWAGPGNEARLKPSLDIT